MKNFYYRFKTKTGKYLVLAFLITFQTLFAQTGKISGIITDKQTGDELWGANVLLVGTTLGAATDMYGEFNIPLIPYGTYIVSIRYLGYQEKTIVVELNEQQQSYDIKASLEAEAIEGETVLVTVQAIGQRSAINQQISSNTISNVVSKSRIQELPDVNAAESIGRLPGVAISRSGGEANKVSIRGLSPKYNTVTVNGVRLPSNSGEDRSVDLSLISSNMLAGIEVKKANTADMDADALGGTIDLRLKEAPKEMQVNLNAQGGYSKMLKDWGNYNFFGNVSNRFLDNKLGVILGFNADSYNRSADQYSGSYTRKDTPEGVTQNIINVVTTRDIYTIRDRQGASLVLDYTIPNGKITANGFFNRLSWDQLRREQRYDLGANRHYFNYRDNGGETNIFTAAVGLEQDFDWMKYDFSISSTGSKTSAPDERAYEFVREGAAFAGAVDVNTHPTEVPLMATNDSTRIGIQDVYRFDTQRHENNQAIQFNFQIPFTINEDVNGYVKAGGKFRWLSRKNDEQQFGRNGLYYGNNNGPNQFLATIHQRVPEWNVEGLVDEYGVLPLSHFLSDYSRDNFLDGKFPLGFQANFDMLHQMYDALNMVTDSSNNQMIENSIGSLGNDYDGVEHYQAGYIMAEFSLGKYFTFIPGFRYENDYSKYTAYTFREVTINNLPGPPADLDTITTVRQNDFLLPYIHLISNPTDWLKIRLAYTKTLTRPDFNMYAPVTRINSYNDYMRAANTKIKPAVSTNYDLSISIYENYIGLFTISGFYKDIKDLIFQYNYPINPDIPLLDGFIIPENWTKSVPYGADTYINNKNKANYKGFEIDWQTNFWYIPFLEGVVLNINYTRIFSEMDKQQFLLRKSDRRKPGAGPPRYYMELFDTSRTSRLPDQPAHIANVTLGYDYKGFSARLSYLYQTNKVAYIDNNEELDQFTGDYSRWDLSLQQKFMDNFQMFCNFTNLNERPDESFRGRSTNNPTFIEYYGLTVDFGIRYKL